MQKVNFKKITNFLNIHQNRLQLIGFILCFISLFIFCYNIRQQLITCFSQRTFLWGINYLAYVGFFLILISTRKSYSKLDFLFHILPIVSIVFPMQMIISGYRSPVFFIMYCSCCIFSLYFMMVEFSPEIRPTILRYFLIAFNILIIIMVVWACIDNIFDKPILKWLSENIMTYNEGFTDFAYPTDTETDRFFSFFGHPLRNAFLFNSFYVINISYNESHKPIMPSWLCCILSFIALACCGSKTGLFVAIAITAIAFYKNVKLLIFLIIGIIIIACSGLMSNLIVRLTTMPLTTGRFSALKELFADNNYPLHLFSGYHSVQLGNHSIAAFEFPIIFFSYEYGILFGMLILGTIFSYVAFHLLRKKHYKIFLLWMLLFGEINTYPNIAQDLDESLIFCFISMIILNISYDTCIPFKENIS